MAKNESSLRGVTLKPQATTSIVKSRHIGNICRAIIKYLCVVVYEPTQPSEPS